MAKKNEAKDIVIYVLIGLMAGGLIGYFAGLNTRLFSRSYLIDTANMMRGKGEDMSENAKKMMDAGVMMKERGAKFRDQDLIRAGDSLENAGKRLGTEGEKTRSHGDRMMEVIEGKGNK